ncbi:hypothetical protein GCM10010182_07860 [Actinomadura cremea]|nr:hypothetical protein GCM10010182_07860 [Actinomadura cremea]
MDTEISASIVTPQPVEVGAEVTVRGTVHWIGRNGPEPLANMTVGGNAGYEVGGVDSVEDGTFEFTFTAQQSGPVTVWTEDYIYLLSSSQARAGMLDVSGAPGFSTFSVDLEPGPAGSREDAITATGRLVKGDTPLAGERIELQQSTDGQESWSRAGTTVTAEDGSFSLRVASNVDAYYRVRFTGSDGNVPGIGPAEYVNVRDLTFMDEFSGRPVTAGVVDLQGKLRRSQDRRPMSSRAVHFYFLPAGQSTWEYRGSTTTDGSGAFAGEFTEQRDGGWTAWFWGDAEYSAASAPVTTVNLRDHWTTEFSRFDVLPKSMAPSDPVTVSGVLNRFRDASDPHRPMGIAPVHVYFQDAGSSTWRQVTVVSTGVDGSFEKSFTATQDGSWTAWYWGDGDHARVNSGVRYVDVR